MGDKPVDPVFMLISKEAKPGQTSKVRKDGSRWLIGDLFHGPAEGTERARRREGYGDTSVCRCFSARL